jgi:hypothetical protein
MDCAIAAQRGSPLTQLQVGLGSASPTLSFPLPHWGEGRIRGRRGMELPQHPVALVERSALPDSGLAVAVLRY